MLTLIPYDFVESMGDVLKGFEILFAKTVIMNWKGPLIYFIFHILISTYFAITITLNTQKLNQVVVLLQSLIMFRDVRISLFSSHFSLEIGNEE